MHRREFIRASGVLAGGALAGCGVPLAGSGASPAAGGRLPLDAAAFHRERRFVRTRFGNVAYVERGSGPGALFLHGYPLSGFQWRGAAERLAAYRHCVLPDFMGLGYTQPAPGRDFTPEAQVAMLVALLDGLSLRAVDVVASDSGGQAAQILVARHPDRVRSLLLTNCDTEIDSPPDALLPVIELAKRGKFVDEMLRPQRDDPTFARSPEGIGGLCYADPKHPTNDAVEYYFGPLVDSAARRRQAHAYVVELERNPLVGIGPALKRFEAPVRTVWGMADTIFSPGGPTFLDRAFGNSRGVRRLEDSKLFWPEERPDVIAEEALALWDV